MLSFSHPQTPLDGGLVRSPDARPQPVELYRPPEHIECSAFPSARDKLAVHGLGTDECGHQRMYAPGHRQRILPRAVKECCIDEQHRSPGCEEQKVGHFYCVGVMHADAPLAEYRREKQDVVLEAAQKDAVHPAAT